MAKKMTASKLLDAEFIEDAAVFGQLIRVKHTVLGIKLADCVAFCDIVINTLYRLENGNANCTLSAMFSVIKGIGIEVTLCALAKS